MVSMASMASNNILMLVWLACLQQSLICIDNVESCGQLKTDANCKICSKVVEDDDCALECEQCSHRFHQSCLKMSVDEFSQLEKSDITWGCCSCIAANHMEEEKTVCDAGDEVMVSMAVFSVFAKKVTDEMKLMPAKVASLQPTKNEKDDICSLYEAVVKENSQLRAEVTLKSTLNPPKPRKETRGGDIPSATQQKLPKEKPVLVKQSETEQPKKKQSGFYTQEKPENKVVLSWRNKDLKRDKSKGRGKKFGIFGDSMLKRLRGNVMSNDIENGFMIVKNFDGSKAGQVGKHMEIHLQDTKDFDAIVVHAGTNNLAPRKLEDGSRIEQSAAEIAEEVIGDAKVAKEYGVKGVLISLITDRSRFRAKARDVHELLKQGARRKILE